MSRLRRLLDRMHPHFIKGGRYEKFEALFEMVDTFLYTPADVTRTAPHVRDGIDLKRVMTYVVIALIPCTLMALYNTGLQANLVMAKLGISAAATWPAANHSSDWTWASTTEPGQSTSSTRCVNDDSGRQKAIRKSSAIHQG